ncbi:MAG TPA: hypothetical protein VIM61_00620 [Chthoniobacterales bacterium]
MPNGRADRFRERLSGEPRLDATMFQPGAGTASHSVGSNVAHGL